MSNRQMNNQNRNGCGNQGKGNRKQNQKTISKKKTLTDYNYYVGTAKQASEYENTTAFIMNFIKKTYENGRDIKKALKDLEPYDMTSLVPSLQISIATEAEMKEQEDKQFELQYRIEYDQYFKRKRIYENNLVKAYSLIWERCSIGMQSRLEATKDFETRIYDDPIEFLKTIKEHALNFQEDKYPMEIITNALFSFLLCKQKENEHLNKYTKRLNVAREVLESHIGGPLILTKCVNNNTSKLTSYDATDAEPSYKETFEHLCAYIYLNNLDMNKYGSVIKGLKSQQSLENELFPKSVAKSTHVLSQHKFDNAKEHNKNKRQGNDTNKNGKQNDNDNDEDEPITTLLFAQLEGKCYCCGKAGHKSTTCRHKDRPKNEWVINKIKNDGMQNVQQQQEGNENNDNNETTNTSSDANSNESMNLFNNMQSITQG